MWMQQINLFWCYAPPTSLISLILLFR